MEDCRREDTEEGSLDGDLDEYLPNGFVRVPKNTDNIDLEICLNLLPRLPEYL